MSIGPESDVFAKSRKVRSPPGNPAEKPGLISPGGNSGLSESRSICSPARGPWEIQKLDGGALEVLRLGADVLDKRTSTMRGSKSGRKRPHQVRNRTGMTQPKAFEKGFTTKSHDATGLGKGTTIGSIRTEKAIRRK